MRAKTISPASTNTLASQCLELLQDDIVNGILPPGQKLKIEILKERFSVGQSPLREALSRLVTIGLVEAEDNKGFRVARISEEDIRDTYHTFFQIELLATEQALIHGDDTWEAGIVGTLHQLGLLENKDEAIPYAQWAERNNAFHVALITGCNSPHLLQLRYNIFQHFDRYCRTSFHTRNRPLHANHHDHQVLAQAALQRDKALVRQLTEEHILGDMENVINNFQKSNIL